jgi:hypothetical protein
MANVIGKGALASSGSTGGERDVLTGACVVETERVGLRTHRRVTRGIRLGEMTRWMTG